MFPDKFGSDSCGPNAPAPVALHQFVAVVVVVVVVVVVTVAAPLSSLPEFTWRFFCL